MQFTRPLDRLFPERVDDKPSDTLPEYDAGAAAMFENYMRKNPDWFKPRKAVQFSVTNLTALDGARLQQAVALSRAGAVVPYTHVIYRVLEFMIELTRIPEKSEEYQIKRRWRSLPSNHQWVHTVTVFRDWAENEQLQVIINVRCSGNLKVLMIPRAGPNQFGWDNDQCETLKRIVTESAYKYSPGKPRILFVSSPQERNAAAERAATEGPAAQEADFLQGDPDQAGAEGARRVPDCDSPSGSFAVCFANPRRRKRGAPAGEGGRDAAEGGRGPHYSGKFLQCNSGERKGLFRYWQVEPAHSGGLLCSSPRPDEASDCAQSPSGQGGGGELSFGPLDMRNLFPQDAELVLGEYDDLPPLPLGFE